MMERASRLAFAVAAGVLMALAVGLLAYALSLVAGALLGGEMIGRALLDAVGYLVIAIAVFEVGKFLVEEEVIRAREMRHPAEARRSLTKFLSAIAIAVFLEALVAVFEAGKSDIRLMLYPTLLLLAGVALVLGLAVFQRLSAEVERTVGERDRRDAAEEKAKPAVRKSKAGIAPSEA